MITKGPRRVPFGGFYDFGWGFTKARGVRISSGILLFAGHRV